jgi:uncharacterized Zn finger protein (UPF0148 family)
MCRECARLLRPEERARGSVRCGGCQKRARVRKAAYRSRQAEAAESRRQVEERGKQLAARLAEAQAEQSRLREDAAAKADAEALRAWMRRDEQQRRDAEEDEARLQAEASRLKGPTFATLFEGARRLRRFSGW